MSLHEPGTSPLDPTALSPGTNVLVSGPAMTGKRELVYELVGGAPDRAAMLVTTKKSAAQTQREFTRARDLSAWRLRFVDAVSRQRGVGDTADGDAIRYVSSPGDLTGIGISLSGFMREFYHDCPDRGARVGMHSLSTLLMYADLQRVYRFLHVVTGRIDSSGFVGAFAMDTTGGTGSAAETLMQVFDAVVEVRDGEQSRELRVRGGDFGPRGWTAF